MIIFLLLSILISLYTGLIPSIPSELKSNDNVTEAVIKEIEYKSIKHINTNQTKLNLTQYGCKTEIMAYPSNWPNSHYYKRYCLSNRGLSIITDGIATDAALDRTAYILDSMMANMEHYVPDKMIEVLTVTMSWL